MRARQAPAVISMISGTPVLNTSDDGRITPTDFFGAIGEHDGMRYAFAVEEDVGFFDDGNVVELIAHVIFPSGSIQRASCRRRPASSGFALLYERRWIPAFAGVRFSGDAVKNKLFAALDLRIGCNSHAQCVEFDEATGISLIVGTAIFIKCRDVHVK